MVKKKAPDEVRASVDFSVHYGKLKRTSEEFRRISAGIESVRENWQVGDKVGREKFPQYYVEKYGISNLYRLDNR